MMQIDKHPERPRAKFDFRLNTRQGPWSGAMRTDKLIEYVLFRHFQSFQE